MMRAAKRYIDNLGTHELLGAYVSPSHAGSVAKKLNSAETIGIDHRLAMIHLAIEKLDWVMVDYFEIFQPCDTRPLIIMKAFLSRIRSQLPNGTRIYVFWLTDHDSLTRSLPPDELLGLGFHILYAIPRRHNEDVNKTTNQFSLAPDYQQERWRVLRSLSGFQQRSAKAFVFKSRFTIAFNFRFHITHVTDMHRFSSAIRACACNSSFTRNELQICTGLDRVTEYILKHRLWRTAGDTIPPIIPNLFDRVLNDTDVTLEYLSHMLSAYSDKSVHVISFKQRQIGIGEGFTSRVHHIFNVQHSSDSPDHLLLSMVLKIPYRDTNGIAVESEQEFYVNIAPRIANIKIPKCYYVAQQSNAEETGLLLLEDLSVNYYPFNTTSWKRDSTFYAVVAAIASLHAEFFEHSLFEQESFTWLRSLNSTIEFYQKAYAFSLT
jgi:hypothetical protein